MSALALALTVEVWAVIDLPRDDPRSHGLSGLAWDGDAHILYAVADHPPAIVEMVPDRELRHVAFGRFLHLPEKVDGEGITLAPKGFLIADENGHILEVTYGGKIVGERALPKDFRHFRDNRGIESLSTTPDGEALVYGNEETLIDDGPPTTPRNGSLIRIIRVQGQILDEFKYLTDVLPGPRGDLGVSDITPMSKNRVLVLERGYVPRAGNFVRLYDSPLTGATPIPKTLVADFAELHADPLPPAPAPQRSPLLDNYEGMALGPIFPDGRRVLFVVSDDNDSPMQVPRLLVLLLRE